MLLLSQAYWYMTLTNKLICWVPWCRMVWPHQKGKTATNQTCCWPLTPWFVFGALIFPPFTLCLHWGRYGAQLAQCWRSSHDSDRAMGHLFQGLSPSLLEPGLGGSSVLSLTPSQGLDYHGFEMKKQGNSFGSGGGNSIRSATTKWCKHTGEEFVTIKCCLVYLQFLWKGVEAHVRIALQWCYAE